MFLFYFQYASRHFLGFSDFGTTPKRKTRARWRQLLRVAQDGDPQEAAERLHQSRDTQMFTRSDLMKAEVNDEEIEFV